MGHSSNALPAYVLFLIPVLLFSLYLPAQERQQLDILLINGKVMDGTGNPWFYADVGIRGGRIVAVGRLKDKAAASRTIDVSGKLTVPGFIDVHSHAYDNVTGPDVWKGNDEKRYSAPNFVTQGITTLVSNECGGGPLSIAAQRAALKQHGTGPNVILLAGHNTIRRHVLGPNYRRTATPEEVEKMKALVHQAMEDGAYGMSAGTEYVPGIWSDTNELVELVKEIVPYGGFYQVHERASGADPMWYVPSQDKPGQPTMLDNVVETIEIGERTGARVIVTHIKARGANYWGSSRAAINLIEMARARGVDVWADCYAYNTTGSDGNTVVIPAWALGKSPREGLKKTLADPKLAGDMRGDIKHEIARRGSAENIIVMEHPDKSCVGKSLAQLARDNKLSDVEMAIKMQLEGFPDRPGGARLRGYSLSEIDVEAFMAQPWTATSTDASITLPEDGPDIHARYYGNYPRKIRHYALERGVITLEQAIRSSTSLPAQIIGLRDRGMIHEGYNADLVVLDLANIRDTATFFQPHQYAAGIDYVMVGGTLVVDQGKLTWKNPGVVITPPK